LNPNPSGLFGFYSDKVFPEEVDNIKDFMRGAFTTNVGGFVDENGNTLGNDRDSKDIVHAFAVDDMCNFLYIINFRHEWRKKTIL
jgi:hypothetical protein